MEGEQTRDDKVRVAVSKVKVFRVQGVEFEYAEQEGYKGEEEEGGARTEHAIGCYYLYSGLSVCSSDL